ncbi:tyrosine-type recombinase/integrase [Halobellus rubicundus]|uniref:Tyrosine-type recombinase/integrase n=1 Tax=Halobellus rubicundus TaxID=2996466 RepID=A0ABD5M891_9EURY
MSREHNPPTDGDRPRRLEPTEPTEAKQLYLRSRQDELAERSLELHDKHLTSFSEWCIKNDIRNLNDVTARTVHEYHLALKEEYQQSTVSIYLSTVRQFVRFCEGIDAVPRGVAERIVLPERERNASSEMLESDEATEILGYLRKYHYGSRSHALFALLWHTGIRTGTAQGLDVSDFEAERDRLRIRHRPDTGSPLKNGENAERFVTLSTDVSAVIDAYVDEHRHDVVDDHGREPLFTTHNGRPAKNSIRRTIYAVTRPCQTGRGCPHGEDPDTCEAAQRTNDACKCPSTVSGHPVRRGAITHHLRQDVPEKVVSDRMNVSQDVLDRHYDRRSEDEKAEQRRQFLDKI